MWCGQIPQVNLFYFFIFGLVGLLGLFVHCLYFCYFANLFLVVWFHNDFLFLFVSLLFLLVLLFFCLCLFRWIACLYCCIVYFCLLLMYCRKERAKPDQLLWLSLMYLVKETNLLHLIWVGCSLLCWHTQQIWFLSEFYP